MTASGPCPIFEGRLSLLFYLRDADMRLFVKIITTEIGSNTGPLISR